MSEDDLDDLAQELKYFYESPSFLNFYPLGEAPISHPRPAHLSLVTTAIEKENAKTYFWAATDYDTR